MKRITFAATLATAVGLGSAVRAENPGPYITIEGGGAFLPSLSLDDAALGKGKDTFKPGYAAGGAVGTALGDGFCLELSSLYQASAVHRANGASASGHLTATSVMANGTYDILAGAPFTPYVGAGVGGEVGALHGRAWEPAYQVEAGLRDDLSSRIGLFGEYRFSQSKSVRLADATDFAHQHFMSSAVMAGLTLKL